MNLVEITPAAQRLECSIHTVRRLVDTGQLAAIRTISGQRLIFAEALEALARERERRAAEAK